MMKLHFLLVISSTALLATSTSGVATAGRATVTNEDIRDAILQVVNVVRATEDKLERHEYRERVLGENLKKGMISIDKRIKLLEPFKGTISRLDQRLANVETILMAKEEREKQQLQKTFEAVEDIQKNLPLIMDKLKSDVMDRTQAIKSEPAITKSDFDKFQKMLTEKLDKVTSTIHTMEQDIEKIKADNKDIKEINTKSSENLDKVKRQLNTSEQLLEKYENKLAEYNNRLVPDMSADYVRKDWQPAFLQALEAQKSNVDQILADVKTMSSKVNQLPDKSVVENAHNVTLDSLARLKDAQSLHPQHLDTKVKELTDEIGLRHGHNLKSFNEVAQNIETLNDKFTRSYEDLRKEVEQLGKVEAVIVQTADSVLDTKRKVEYGVHHIIAEMQQQIKTSTKDVGDAINERFDTFEMLIIDEDGGALANLTSKIGAEIDQVWRQIGIMHQQISASTDTLNKLQNQTDTYVSGSLNVMDNMKGKVGTITSRITEVDENLNYLMGKLSMVTQEFNQIKSGLGKALDEMRGTYQAVKDKFDPGPGPHKIPADNNAVNP